MNPGGQEGPRERKRVRCSLKSRNLKYSPSVVWASKVSRGPTCKIEWMLRKGLSDSWQRGGKSWRRRDFRMSPPLLCALARWAWYLLPRLAFLDTNLAWGLLGRRLDAGRKTPRKRSETPSSFHDLVHFPKRSPYPLPFPIFLSSRPIQELRSSTSSVCILPRAPTRPKALCTPAESILPAPAPW